MLFGLFLFVSTAMIMVFDALWSPFPEPRYRMDFSWLLGFAADGVGILCLLSALIPMGFPGISETGYEDQILAPLMGNCFRSLPALVWTLAAIALAGVCIYAFDKRAMARCQLLSEGEKHRIALAMAVITAPWLFLVPMY